MQLKNSRLIEVGKHFRAYHLQSFYLQMQQTEEQRNLMTSLRSWKSPNLIQVIQLYVQCLVTISQQNTVTKMESIPHLLH